MPSCVLRVAGATSKVREFCEKSRLEPLQVFWKGKPVNPASKRVSAVSGFNIELSVAEGLVLQATQASQFIHRHKVDFMLIKSLGFKAISIDFGLYDLATEDRPWPSYSVPASLITLASEIGASIDLSFYGAAPNAP